jgi:hypothetical protein
MLYLLCTGELFAVLLMMYTLGVLLIDHPRPHTYLWKGAILYLVLVSGWPHCTMFCCVC